MKKFTLSNVVARSQKIRDVYHQLELKHHGSAWSVEEDALAFLTDAALVGRLTMAHQGRWPVEKEFAHELEHKLGECIWWLIVLAERMEVGAEAALEAFLAKTEQQLNVFPPAAPSQIKPKRRAKKSLRSAAIAARAKR